MTTRAIVPQNVEVSGAAACTKKTGAFQPRLVCSSGLLRVSNLSLSPALLSVDIMHNATTWVSDRPVSFSYVDPSDRSSCPGDRQEKGSTAWPAVGLHRQALFRGPGHEGMFRAPPAREATPRRRFSSDQPLTHPTASSYATHLVCRLVTNRPDSSHFLIDCNQTFFICTKQVLYPCSRLLPAQPEIAPNRAARGRHRSCGPFA